MKYLLIVLSFVGLTSLMPVVASAYTPFNGDVCNGASNNSAVCASRTTKNPLTGTDGLLDTITNIVAYIAGAAAIIIIIVGGISYMTSGGDPAKVSSAKNTVVYALIGILVIVIARALIIYVISQV